MEQGSLIAALPEALPAELVDVLVSATHVRIERIVSLGQRSAPDFWYDQDEHEWVVVVTGGARLSCEGEPARTLVAGDWIHLPAHTRHRVTWTDPERPTVWLAVFYR
jgi:cupin 2 domain-containing protein